MKITGLQLIRHTVSFEPAYPHGDRNVGPLDVYEEYAADLRRAAVRGPGGYRDGQLSGAFLVIETDEGVEGVHGPIAYRSQLLAAVDGLAGHLIGRDPLENRLIWDVLSRFDRHSRAGVMLMAISTVDIALWDLKGKILGQPVYKLLGGGRGAVRPYISALGFPVEPKAAAETARRLKAEGAPAQKWFFRYGPSAGAEGMRKNLDMAFAVREALGEDYGLAFDCWMGWSMPYAREMLRRLEPVRPMWVEEVLRPHMLEGYRHLRQQTQVPLSAGEHLYMRMEVKPFLEEGIFAVMQSDPEWCGGITEAMRIGDLCELYQTTFIPHGHALMPALHVVAAMPPDISPYCEVLIHSIDGKTAFFRDKRIGPDGILYLNDTPGLGEELDMERILHSEKITAFTL